MRGARSLRPWIGWLALAAGVLFASTVAAGPDPHRALVEALPAAEAPAFHMLDMRGAPVTNGGLRGAFVVLNFWATWCVPCVREMPALQALQDRFKERPLRVVGVNVMDPQPRIAAFLAERSLGIQIARDASGQVFRDFGVVGFPTTLVLDPEGRVVGRAMGARAWDSPEAIAYFQGLLAGRASGEAGASGSSLAGVNP
jgi:thiol-disulfide isomerase/thioredoxin